MSVYLSRLPSPEWAFFVLFAGGLPPTIGQLQSLKELFVDFNQLSGPWPIELLLLLPQLKAFRFRSNAFTLPPMGEAEEAALAAIANIEAPDCALRYAPPAAPSPSRDPSHSTPSST